MGAAPAPPSYLGVRKAIGTIRQSWSAPGAAAQPNQAGWNTLFDTLLSDLKAYNTATSDADRLEALKRVHAISTELADVSWAPAHALREQIRQWLRPRLHLAEARRLVKDTLASLPPTADPKLQANRARWLDFMESDLGAAISEYDRAETVTQRLAALRRIDEASAVLEQLNQNRPWSPTLELEAAVKDLFRQPNLEVVADVAVVSPYFNTNLVETGPIYRKGYWSQVTAGPKTGFGLLPSDDGIAFYNKQTLTSVTPITDFQKQIADDPQGRRAAKLYYFCATTFDWSELTITTVLRPSGLTITPYQTHNIDADISSSPTPDGHVGRSLAALIGLDQEAITKRVKDGAIPKFKERIPAEALEEAYERIAKQTIERNADLRSRGLVGENTFAVQNVLITQLALRSRPEAVFVGGLLRGKEGPVSGADAPRPESLATANDPGVTADVHLGSLLSNGIAALLERDDVRSVDNVMVSLRNMGPGTAPRDATTITKNVDFPTYIKAVDDSRKGAAKMTVLRVFRPRRAPQFTVDARSNLVALIHDFQVDVPAPESEARGGVVGAAAKIYRIKVPLLEIGLSFKVTQAPGSPLRIHAEVQDFSPGPDAEVLAITDDETKAVPLSRFSSAIILGGMGGRLRSQPIDLSADRLKLPGFTIRSISPLDPSGWLRVRLEPSPEPPPAGPIGQPAPVSEAPPVPSTQPVAPNG
jgi:hypothetical protein